MSLIDKLEKATNKETCWEESMQLVAKVINGVLDLQAENKQLRELIKGNEEICRQRNIELKLHKAAAKAAKSGLKSDLSKYIKLIQTLKGE